MTLSIDDVATWEPDHLTTAAANANNMHQSVDQAVKKGVEDTAQLGTDQTWSGTAAEAANKRMDTEKTRASQVSEALVALHDAFTAQVENLKHAKEAVLRLRDIAQASGPCRVDSDKREPGFTVSANGDVNPDTRIQWYKDNLNEHEANTMSDAARTSAAQLRLDIVNALAEAERVAGDAKTAVDTAVGKLKTAYDGLGDPNLTVPQAPNTSTAPAAVATSPSTSNTSKPSYATGNHNGNGAGSHSSAVYSGGTSSGGPPAEMPSGDKAKWIQEALKVLKDMGYDTSDPDLVADISEIIKHESADNPRAFNDWDSNAAAGTPSKGVMQTIDSTFNAHMAPGHGDIWNPVDNIVAGVRYATDRYGSVHNVPGLVSMRGGGAYQGY